MPGPVWTILTPAAAPGAIGIVQIRDRDGRRLTRLLKRLGLDVPRGRPVLRDLLGVDRGPIVRWDDATVDLFPHGGPAILRRLTAALTDAGVDAAPESHRAYPEAGDEIEARMLAALARAASPLAIDLLLDQPRRWAGGPPEACADARVLDRLVDPPLVVAIGPANIGKSTLLNALAGRPVAIVADAPGTTRDHVGALLDLDGLVVRYLDTPGVMETTSAIDLEAQRLAERTAREADLLLLCGDPGSPCPTGDQGTDAIRVCLRADLGGPAWAADAVVSVHRDRESVGVLASTIRERLVPLSALEDPRPWVFPGLDAD